MPQFLNGRLHMYLYADITDIHMLWNTIYIEARYASGPPRLELAEAELKRDEEVDITKLREWKGDPRTFTAT